MTSIPVSGFVIVAVMAAPAQAYATWSFRLPRRYVLLISICRNAVLIVGLLLLLSAESVSLAAIGLRFGGGFALLSGTVVATTVILGLDLATTRLLVSNPQARSRAVQQLESRIPRSSFERVLFCLLAAVGAAWEELAFRGAVLYVASLWSISTGLAIAAGVAIFGAQHIGGGLNSVVYSSLMGTIFFILYLCLGSIVPVMVAHCVGNLFVVFRTYPLLLSRERKASRAIPADRPIIPL